MEKLLPQANTLATVIRTFKLIGNTIDCTLNDIAGFNNFDIRQAAYYSNACFYLGLIDENLKLTPLGDDIFQEPKQVKIRIYELIINDDLIGRLFAKTALYSKRTALREGKKIISSIYGEKYGQAVIDRRTSCLIGWCEEILDYLREQKNK